MDELVEITDNELIGYNFHELRQEALRVFATLALDRTEGDIDKAARSTACRSEVIKAHYRARPLRRFGGIVIASLAAQNASESIDEFEHRFSLALIAGAKSILRALPTKSNSKREAQKMPRVDPEESIEKEELVRPAARLLCIKEYELRQTSTRGKSPK